MVNVSKVHSVFAIVGFLWCYISNCSLYYYYSSSLCLKRSSVYSLLSSHPQYLWLTLLILCTFHKPIQNKLLLSSWMHIPLYFSEKNTNRNLVIESKFLIWILIPITILQRGKLIHNNWLLTFKWYMTWWIVIITETVQIVR